MLLSDAGCGQLDEVHHRAWEARGAEILARRADGDRHAAGVDLETCLLRKARHERVGEVGCLLLALRLEPHDLHEPAQQRPRLHEAGRARRRRLGPHDQAAGGDGGQDLVEDARGLALVRTAAGELQHVGDVPDELLGGGKLGDGLLDAGLELAEPLLACHQVGAAGFEHLPARLLETVGEQTQERGLAHAVLAADQQRARRRLPRHRLGSLQHLLPHLGLDQQLALLAVAPEAAERAEERAVDAGALVAVELLGQLHRERMMDALQEGLDGGMRRGVAGVEGGAEGGKLALALALGKVVAKKTGHDQVLAPPVLGRHHGRADRRRHVHGPQVAKREVDRPGIDLVEVGDDVVGDLAAVRAGPQGGQRHAGQRPVGAERVLLHRLQRRVGAFEQPDGLGKLLVVLELARVRIVRGERAEHGLQCMQALGEAFSGCSVRRRRIGCRRLGRGCVGLGEQERRLLGAPGRRDEQAGGEPQEYANEKLQVVHPTAAGVARQAMATVRIWRRGVNVAHGRGCALGHTFVRPARYGSGIAARLKLATSWPLWSAEGALLSEDATGKT